MQPASLAIEPIRDSPPLNFTGVADGKRVGKSRRHGSTRNMHVGVRNTPT
jgi:hypothetical protein